MSQRIRTDTVDDGENTRRKTKDEKIKRIVVKENGNTDGNKLKQGTFCHTFVDVSFILTW